MCLVSEGILGKYVMAEAWEIVMGKKPNQAVPKDWIGEFDDGGNAAFYLFGEEANPRIDPFRKGYCLLRDTESRFDS